jgi:hypothetical protein
LLIFTLSEARDQHANEDVARYAQHPADSRFALCALADGQGGQSGGAAAATLGVSSALAAACASEPKSLFSPSAWLDICAMVDRRVAAEPNAGFCTLVTLVATAEWVVGASSGDSAAILLFDASEFILTDRQRKNPPVGSGAAIFEPFSSALEGWWRILILSDGVWKYAGWDNVIRRGREADGQTVIDKLREDVLVRSGGLLPDDFSVIAIEP